MRYINTRAAFLGTVNEAFVNDITWGGSLLGRLVNSVIREAKIGINYARVGSIAKAIEKELMALVAKGMSPEDQATITNITAKFLLEEIYKTVHETETSDRQKIEHLVGQGEAKGLIDEALAFIKILSDDVQLGAGDKKTLISKLEKFKEELKAIVLPTESEEDKKKRLKADEDKELGTGAQAQIGSTQSQGQAGAAQGQAGAAQGQAEQDKKLGIEGSKEVGTKGEEPNEEPKTEEPKTEEPKTEEEPTGDGSGDDDRGDTFTHNGKKYQRRTKAKPEEKGEDYFKGCTNRQELKNTYRKLSKKYHPDTGGDTADIEKFKDISIKYNKKLKEIYESLNILLSYSDFMSINEADEVVPAVEPTEHANITHTPPEEKGKTISTDITDEEDNTKDSVKKVWDRNFKEGEHKEWEVSKEESKKEQQKFEKAKFQIDLVDKSGEHAKDRIIKIANLFGKAYKLYTVPIIPSGRPGGKISNSTYREYIYVGKGDAKVPGKEEGPGYGPWVSKLVFNKFSEEIASFIEREELKKVFNNGVIKRSDGKPNQPGNVLLEFIRNMIDENTLHSYDKNRSALLTKYFGLESAAGKVPSDGGGGKKPDAIVATGNVDWREVSPIDESNTNVGEFIAIHCNYFSKKEQKTKDRKFICEIIMKQDKKILLKWQNDNESIPVAYCGIKYQPVLAGTKSNTPVNIGLIDLGKTPLNETKEFIMVSRDINKLTEIPNENVYTPQRKGTARVKVGAMYILSKKDEKGTYTPIISPDLDKLDKTIVEQDIRIPNIATVFSELETALKNTTLTIR